MGEKDFNLGQSAAREKESLSFYATGARSTIVDEEIRLYDVIVG